jgi:hypothetical protein
VGIPRHATYRQDGGLISLVIYFRNKAKSPWPEYASELYRSSDRSMSAKLVPTFADIGVSRGQDDGSPRPYFRVSRPVPLLFLPSNSSIVLTRLGGTLFLTHYFSENLVVPEIEPGRLDL